MCQTVLPAHSVQSAPLSKDAQTFKLVWQLWMQNYIQQNKNKCVPLTWHFSKNGKNCGREKRGLFNGQGKKKKSLFKFSLGYGVKSKVVEIESRTLSLPLLLYFSPVPFPISFSCVTHLEFGGRRYRGHKSHCYWCGYEPQPNGDDSARSFSSGFPLQRWALDTVHLTCHFPVLHSAICTEPIRTKRTFNFICSSTLQGFFLFSGYCPVQCSSLWCAILPSHFQGLLLCFFCCDDCS